MNRLRIIGLVLLAALLVWLAWLNLTPDTPAPAPAPVPVREAFHPSKPLVIEVAGPADASHAWADRELRHMLGRGKMKLAPRVVDADAQKPFTLRIDFNADGAPAEVSLIAPDGIVDKRETVAVSNESRLATMQSFAQMLPTFLSAPTSTSDWSSALGTADPSVYDAFLSSADELLDPSASGFTLPTASRDAATRLERVERLSKRNRDFARARALLALGYLSVGGEDQASLTKLAEGAAERALATDAELADARAALGIVRARRMEWTAAQEHFAAALAIDPSSLPALTVSIA